MTPLTVATHPCSTCPYRKDVPSGLWHLQEYEKLRKYDAEPMADGSNFGVFLCHKTLVCGDQIACKGFLIVHSDSIAVRLAQSRGIIDESAFAPTTCELHESGNATADYGERDILHPNSKAIEAVNKLKRTGKFKT